MESAPRGIRCSLPSRAINKLLLYISQLKCEFFIPWYFRITRKETVLPVSAVDYCATSQMIREMACDSIFELVLHMYPPDAAYGQFESYEDFAKSSCVCCLIYYDCGWLDIYVKGDSLRRDIQNHLLLLSAEDMEVLTETNDGREALTL